MSATPQNDGDTLNEVNVIPLADVTLVLLIIIMVISPMIMQSMIKVQATRANAVKSLAEKPPEPPLILSLSPGGVMTLNATKVRDMLDLATQLAIHLGKRTDKTVLVTVDPLVEHGFFVTALDTVKQQGAEKIALLKKRPGAL